MRGWTSEDFEQLDRKLDCQQAGQLETLTNRKLAVAPVERPEGKIEFDGKAYVILPGAALVGRPEWPVGVTLEQFVLRRSYATDGADEGGEIRPVGGRSLQCIERTESNWARPAQRSWPLNAVWRQDPPLEKPWFDFVVYIPKGLFLEILNAAAAGGIDRTGLNMRLERAFVIDRERPNGGRE